MPSRHRRPPSPWRRRSRALLVGLTSLTLILSGTATLATPGDDAEMTELLSELASDAPLEAETGDAAAEEEGATDAVEEPAAEEPAVEEPAVEEPAADEAVAEEPAAEEPAAEEAEEPAAEESAAEAADQDVTPLFVPPGDPGPGEVKLIVRSGSDRTGAGDESTTATPLAGVDYEFYRVTDFPPEGPPNGVLVGECTTDATGECGIFADLVGAVGGVDAFYAVQTDAPGAWTAPTQWAAGSDYIFATGPVSAADSVAERTIELPLAYSDTVEEPIWASVRENNLAPPQCGLDVAMVVDLSNSVTESSALLDQYKESANGFIEALTGTPSQIALYTFATAAPADGAANTGLPLTSVATPGSASALTARINGFTPTPAMGGGTNWDRGFHQVAESGESYDIVLFLTDGQPTFHRDRQGPGDVATIAEVNEAILSANAVKATGAQVILVGIGPEAPLPGASIRIPLVSGPTEGVDFFRTDFDDLEQTLIDIASENCAGTLTVVKEVEELDGDVVEGGPGWTFSTPTEGITPASATTDATSAVNFQVSYPDGALSREITVAETQQAGYELVQVGGANAVCTDTTTGAAVPVVNSGGLGFTVEVPVTDVISCTVRNAESPPDYDDLTVTKTAQTSFVRDWDWDIDKVAEEDYLEVPAGEDGTFTYDVTVTPEGPVDSGFTVAGTITVTNPNDVAFTGVDVLDSLPAGTCTVTGGTDATVGANDSLTLAYSCAPTAATAATTGTNTVTATWSTAAFPGTSGTATATADFDFADAEITEVDRFVTVTDSDYDLSTYPGGNTFDATDGEVVLTYDLTWPSTPGECVEFPNTATIGNAAGPLFAPLVVNESSTEVVTLCAGLDLEVAKNVVVSFDRTYLWEIDKEADETTVTVDPATGTATVGYTVTATPTGSSDAGWAMQGTVTVANPNEWLDITADVTDTVDVGGGAVCTVAGGTDVLIEAGETVDLSYTCSFVTQPSYSGTNTATATWADTVPTPSASATGTADIEPGDWAQTPINATVDVVDDQTDPANPVELGTATWNAEGTPTVFTYSLTHEGVPGTCVEFTNTAWIDQTQQEADETVTVCEQAPPTVAKTADASFDRQYLWLVEKSVDQTTVTVDEETGEAVFGYVVTATPDGVADTGWELDGTVTVTNPNDFGPLTVTVTDAVDVGGGAVCTVEDGEDVVVPASGTVTLDYSCTFTAAPDGEGVNTATVTWTDSAGDEQVATATADVEFVLDEELDETVDVVDDQTDPANPVTLGPATWSSEGTPVTFEYDLTHTGVPGECVDFTNTAWVEVAGDDPEDSTTAELCVSTLEHTKTAVGADQQADGTWLVRYEIDVVNSSTFADVYSLSDTIEYSDGIEPLGALWFPQGDPEGGGAWTDPVAENPTTVLATDVEIAAGTTDTYVVLVTADVAEGTIGTEAGLCDEEELSEGGGFLNAATLTVLGEDETVRACAEPVAPTVEKTAGELVDNGDGTWDVGYTIDVVNADADQAVSYDLSDAFDFVEGVDILDASIERDGTVYEDWDGVTETEVVTGVLLPAATTHTYAVTVTVSLSDVVATDDGGLRECGLNGSDAGHGLFNEATIVSGNDEYDDEACVPIPDPDMSVDKTAVSANQLPDGTWEVVYEVVATNDSSVGGVYDLTDTLEYSEGITPLTATWELEGTAVAGEWGDLPDELTTTLANDRPLAGGDSDAYVVTVTAAVAAGVTGGEAGQCTGDDGTDGGGFLNAATLTAHGEDDTDRDCLPPAHPDLEKVFDSAVEREDGTWEVTYTIVVDNAASDARAYYQLVDAPRFAEGVTILGQEAWDVTVPEDPQDLDWDGEGPILNLVAIEGGEVQRYEVSFVVEVSAGIPDENLVCDPDGTPGYGFFNRAELRSGNDVVPAEDCGPVGDPAWTLTKSSDPVSGSEVDPGDTITYTVTATPTGDVDPTDLTVTDDLSDVLEHARTTGAIEASVGSVDWDGEDLVWDIPRLSETATLTYRVVVDDDAWDVRLRNVVTGEGTPPPVCIECSTTHITPPRTPGLPPTGVAVAGAALLAALLTAGGLALGTTRRRKEA